MIDKNTPIGTVCRVIDDPSNETTHRFPIGTEVRIKNADLDCEYLDKSDWWAMYPSQLELAEARQFKPGDRCRVIGDTASHEIKTGRVVTLESGAMTIGWHIEESHRWLPSEDLELVEDRPASLKQYSPDSVLERLWSKEKLFSAEEKPEVYKKSLLEHIEKPRKRSDPYGEPF